MLKTIEQRVLKFIDYNHLIEKGEKLLVAFSGGADSVFLLQFLFKYKRRLGINLAAFHLNHKLRGSDADKDAKFCKDYCSKKKIEFESTSRNVKLLAKKQKKSVEEAARELRYSELKKTAEKLKADKIATAHNSSDNAETVLLNFTKGAGLKGSTGIPVHRENIIRPILCLTSDEIRSYLKSNNISYRIDKSNISVDFERNYLRKEIIPKLKNKLNPKLEEKIANTSRILKDVSEFIDKEVTRFAQTTVEYAGLKIKIDLKKLAENDSIINSIFFRTFLEKYFKIELSYDNIQTLLQLIFYQTGKEIHLKGNVTGFRERDSIVFQRTRGRINKETKKQINVGQTINICGKLISIEPVRIKDLKFNRDRMVEYISGDSIKGSFEIRRWKSGDKFNPIGMKGTKKISDFLSDEKISSSEKKENLVLTNLGKIVWVVGLRIDDKFKVTSGTKKVLQLTVRES